VLRRTMNDSCLEYINKEWDIPPMSHSPTGGFLVPNSVIYYMIHNREPDFLQSKINWIYPKSVL